MTKLDKFLSGLFVVQVVVLVNLALPAQTRTQPASAAFDHSTCQYPDRWTNPPDSCDNSDPAVPECIKAASTQQSEADCIAYYAAQHPQPQPVQETKPAQPQAAQCGGK